MIHQYIFAGPKPGLSAEAFMSYWINFHAVDYASKIPQIKQYLVAPRLTIPTGRDLPFFQGVAEIWLRNDEEQIASLQSPEFLQGARADEPRWAAYWQTLAIDTDPIVLREYSGPSPQPDFAKLYILAKRRPDLSLVSFRESLVANGQKHTGSAVCHLIGFARSALYGVGEPRFDAVEALSFADEILLKAALSESIGKGLRDGWDFTDDRYLFAFAAKEHWIIRSGDR